MTATNIEWADRVWNPITGCSKVSQGCKFCYAEVMAKRTFGRLYPPVYIGPGCDEPADEWRARRFTDVQTHADRLDAPLRWRKPSRIFVNSMSDLFHEDVPDAFIDKVFAVMALAPMHTFLVLTKRPERMRVYLSDQRDLKVWNSAWNVCEWFPEAQQNTRHAVEAVARYRDPKHEERWPLPNVWLGVSVEDQATADARIPLLLQTPAAVRWVSAEPLLGPVDLSESMEGYELGQQYLDAKARGDVVEALRLIRHGEPGIDWCVVGGESGPKARSCDVPWVRSVVEQCQSASVPVFVKQLGRWPVAYRNENEHGGRGWGRLFHDSHGQTPTGEWGLFTSDRKGAAMDDWPSDLRVREYPAVTS